MKYIDHPARKALNALLIVEEQRGDLGAFEQVF
jgi:hypothetical protein